MSGGVAAVRRFGWAPLTAAALVAVLTGPSWLDPAQQNTWFTIFTLLALAQAWNLIGGLGGQFSLGNAAFVGAGAYLVGVLLVHTGISWWPAVLLGGLFAAGAAVLVAFPLFRLRGIYFAIGSLAISLAALSWMSNWEFTGATKGLNLPLGEVPLPEELFKAAGVVAILSTLLVYLVLRSRFGLRLMAIRDDEDAATGVGVRGTALKFVAFALSAFVCGITGALMAGQAISIQPSAMFGLPLTTDMIVMTIVGGIGTTAGPVIGVFVVYYLIERQLESDASLSALLTGLLLIVVIRMAPGGIVALLKLGLQQVVDRVRQREVPAP